jgi:hypothetical protein
MLPTPLRRPLALSKRLGSGAEAPATDEPESPIAAPPGARIRPELSEHPLTGRSLIPVVPSGHLGSFMRQPPSEALLAGRWAAGVAESSRGG